MATLGMFYHRSDGVHPHRAGISCKVETGKTLVEAGLHPATGGNGLMACSGNMLLDSLVACAGVTLGAVATALGIEIREGTVRAEGDLDFEARSGFPKIPRWDFNASDCNLMLPQTPRKTSLLH